jgi:hypothetical protein
MKTPHVALALLPVSLLGLFALSGCGGDETEGPLATPSFLVSGDAFPFNEGFEARLEGATVSVLEDPTRKTVTGADGHFAFYAFAPGDEVTLVMEHPDYHLLQTGTQDITDANVELLTFQAVNHSIFDLLASVLGITPDDGACQFATTVTRVGKSLYDEGAHGEAGATVTIDPPLPAEHGPVYFNSAVIPQKSLTETSDDGGVVYTNLPVGEYTVRAQKAGVTFAPVRIKCRAGLLVNASPPHGLQAL